MISEGRLLQWVGMGRVRNEAGLVSGFLFLTQRRLNSGSGWSVEAW